MSNRTRLIEGGYCEVTQGYKRGIHNGIDIVNRGYTLGNILAHSDGIVVEARNNCNSFESGSYGNYLKIKHTNNYYTLYGHMAYNTVRYRKGDKVSKGNIIGYMGNTGESYGGHLHFEVRNQNDERIDPTEYVNSDLPNIKPTPSKKYNIGDIVNINGVYVSSTSTEKLVPAITRGKITRIVEARNPYLLNDGLIGWVNDECIINDVKTYKVVTNCYWLNLRTSSNYGNNIYTTLKDLGYKFFGFNLMQDTLQPRWMHVIDINGKSEEEVQKDMESKTRQILRKNEKCGII